MLIISFINVTFINVTSQNLYRSGALLNVTLSSISQNSSDMPVPLVKDKFVQIKLDNILVRYGRYNYHYCDYHAGYFIVSEQAQKTFMMQILTYFSFLLS